jgi:calcineurin-like phosphoesterase family protein
MIFFTSDTHFDHYNIIKHSHRPFISANDMNQGLIDRWNSKVSHNDTVYHLGDFAFGRKITVGRIKELLNQLNGTIKFCYGNHDNIKLFNKIGVDGKDLRTIKYENKTIVLYHYAMRVWNKSHFGSWHLYGHSHGSLPEADSLSFDVGVDANNYYPLSFDEVYKRLSTKKRRLELEGKLVFVGKKGKPIR